MRYLTTPFNPTPHEKFSNFGRAVPPLSIMKSFFTHTMKLDFFDIEQRILIVKIYKYMFSF